MGEWKPYPNFARPDESTDYLVTVRSPSGTLAVTTLFFRVSPEGGKFIYFDEYGEYDNFDQYVIAWMRMPKPYVPIFGEK